MLHESAIKMAHNGTDIWPAVGKAVASVYVEIVPWRVST